MIRSVLLCLAAGLGLCGGAMAGPVQGSDFKSGNWSGSAYFEDETGRFSHCAMSTDYNSGVSVHFAIDKAYKWRFGLSHADWSLREGDSLPISYQIDRHARSYVTATVVMADFFLAELIATNQVFDQFRRGSMLRVTALRQEYSFRLQGTSRALSATLDCVNRNLNYVGLVAKAPAPAPTPTPQPRTGSGNAAVLSPSGEAPAAESTSIFATAPQDVLDATRFVVRLFSTSDFASYRIVDEPAEDASEFIKTAAVVWQAPEANGTLHVLKSDTATPDSIIADVIADDSKSCDGNFASGKSVVQDNKAVKAAFTACKDGGDYKYYVDYLVFKQQSGKLYLISSVQGQRAEVNETISEALARNVGLTVKP